MATKILVVDDDPRTIELLSQHLQLAGYEVLAASDYEWALYLFRSALPDLVILDICFPQDERLGLDILKSIRTDLADRTMPVLMLTGVSEEELEPVSFDLGATDFVRKSVSTRGLLARIRARLPRPAHEPILVDDHLRVDLAAGEVSVRRAGDWQTTPLEPKLLELLKKLVQNPGQVITRERLEGLFEEADDPAGALNTGICKLREIIEADARNPEYIQTRRGIGYKFRDYR